MPQTPNLASGRPCGLSPAYPAPPRVHWLVLLLVPIIAYIAICILAPNTEPGDLTAELKVASTLLYGAWTIYLCLWIRDLNPQTKTLIVAVVVSCAHLAAAAIALFPPPSDLLFALRLILRLMAAIFGFLLIFAIRDELQQHYNKREPIGLNLSPVMTFFFSYYYFQYHLYRIAKQKQAQSIACLGSSQTPTS